MLNKFLTYIYTKNINSSGSKKIFWKLFRKILLIFFSNNGCRMTIHGQELLMPFNHPIPIYLNDLQFHDRLLTRLSQYLGEKFNVINCIDVGANIGDSIAAMMLGRNNNKNDFYIAVEPTSKFFKFLKKNMSNRNVNCLQLICSDEEKTGYVKFNESNGTANLAQDNQNDLKKSNYLITTTIDKLVSECSLKKSYNLLKIDTDGHDFDIIRGAKNFISENKPAVLMEIDSFGSKNFILNIHKTFELFIKAGYNSVIIYDNIGLIIGMYDLDKKDYIDYLLFYKLSKEYFYYDFLFISDKLKEEFFLKEKKFFIENIKELKNSYMI